MSGRIYTSVISIGSVNLYNVIADPNGVLVAPMGSLAVRSDVSLTYQNTDGASTWTVLGTGSVSTQNVRSMGESQGTTGVKVLPVVNGAAAKTITFTAPTDLTLKNLIFNPVLLSGTETIFYTANDILIATMVVAGTGPDVGSHIDGFGIPAAVFSDVNIADAPELNIRMDAGDTITMDLWNLTGEDWINYDCEFTFINGQGADLPRRFIGSVASPGASVVFSATTVAATGSLTVVTAPLAAGDIILLQNGFENGIDETSIGGSLTGVAGARTPGSNDFDASLLTVTAIRDEILAALNDAANAYSSGWTFAASGVDSIDITRQLAGAIGNSDGLGATTVPPGGVTVSGAALTGGSSSIDGVTLETPSVNMTLEKIYFISLLPATSTPPFIVTLPLELDNVIVNADSSVAGVSPAQLPNDTKRIGAVDTDALALIPGDTIEVTGRAAAGPSVALVVALGQTT